jgi:hypothetical protein
MQQKLDIVRFETWILRVAPKRDFAVSRRNDQTQCASTATSTRRDDGFRPEAAPKS